ncbi:MAG TPA: helicase-related protein [Gemmatimonadales bacterium]
MLVPTRELAMQVAEAIHRYGRVREASVVPICVTAAGTLPRVRQTAYLLSRAHKVAGLVRILDHEAPTLALRGLDIERLSHVVNFNVPESPDAYVHRIGRTGRAGRKGSTRRLDLTRAAMRDMILVGELDGHRVVVEALADEFDLMDIATAAVKLAHESGAGAGEAGDIEVPVPR